MYKIVKDYRDNDILRNSFNDLAKEIYGLDFEDWYENGYWGENYNPYSIIIDNQVVANVSVNRINMLIDGEEKYFLQFGTVMTKKEYRHQGLIRKIIEQIENEYADKTDGFFLFANDSVLEFYPKFGFEKSKEYQYSTKLVNEGKCQFEKVLMNRLEMWKKLEGAMSKNVFCGRFDMVDNPELILFYVTKFMQEAVYYHEKSDTYAIAEIEDDRVFVHNVFSSTQTDLNKVLRLFGKDVKEVILGFVPKDTDGFLRKELKKEDCTFFIKGKALEMVEKEYLRIPSLSHS